ncbi:uncharacterized protein Dere_GG26825 [Drosophila erecta]|uniref:Uncharacterized protein n=1 Tax=Drosophila erecta TaxID=7220 RepID=A0A0Q5VXZ5_DROER|nr:uncharacterized protein Dere_GG26825 [Drosophila erecta]
MAVINPQWRPASDLRSQSITPPKDVNDAEEEQQEQQEQEQGIIISGDSVSREIDTSLVLSGTLNSPN